MDWKRKSIYSYMISLSFLFQLMKMRFYVYI
jgi:hypothetical protein